jgi:hypothetical protein
MGILFGAAAFFVPFFFIKVLLLFLFIGFIGRMFWWRGGGWHYNSHRILSYAEKVRNMSDAEYAEFKNNFNRGDGRYGYGRGCCNHADYHCYDDKAVVKEKDVENK